MQCYFNSTLTCCLFSLCFLQLAGADGHEYHFKHRTLPHARTRRSLTHTRALKSHPSVSINVNQDQSQTKRGERESILCRMPEFTAQSEYVEYVSVANSWQSVGKLYISLLHSHIDCIVQQLSRTCSGGIVDNYYSKCNMQQANRGNYADYDSVPWLVFCKQTTTTATATCLPVCLLHKISISQSNVTYA